ncbi:hypothetical protein QL285_093356 [Trifolium repens]|nr:hypothetical protein QL285_093356 [Trifolium repens]
MENTSTPNLQPKPSQSFSVVKLSFQNYAEIETSFVQDKRPQLNGYWSIIKNDTQFHKLKLNDDYENPLLLIQGWNKIKAFHNLPDNVQIEFLYYGNKTFEIASSKKIKSMKSPHFTAEACIQLAQQSLMLN